MNSGSRPRADAYADVSGAGGTGVHVSCPRVGGCWGWSVGIDPAVINSYGDESVAQSNNGHLLLLLLLLILCHFYAGVEACARSHQAGC